MRTVDTGALLMKLKRNSASGVCLCGSLVILRSRRSGVDLSLALRAFCFTHIQAVTTRATMLDSIRGLRFPV